MNSRKKFFNFKENLLFHLKNDKLYYIGKFGFFIVITVELFYHRIMDSLISNNKMDTMLASELTIIIKTFERPRIVRRLIKSIKRFYPAIPVILVDDSKNPVQIPGIETVIIPFDSGISAGRNKALSLVKTEFLLLVDDDFIFFNSTRLERPLQKMKDNQEIDIMGGQVIDLPFFKIIDYTKESIHPTSALPVMPSGSMIDGLPVLDKVANFYIGRTKSIKKIGWDNQIKRLDHADFFTRAKGQLISVFNKEFKCLHARTIYNKKYMEFRNDIKADQAYLSLKYYSKFRS